jgi:hypothetical protein
MRFIKAPTDPREPLWDRNDENILVTVAQEDGGYILYERGDDIPDQHKPKLLLLRDIPDETVLWRYMDFAKLYSLIEQRAMYFTPARLLRDLEPYEFRLPLELASPEGEDPREPGYLDSKGISCWSMCRHENNALWKVYVPNGGVAIKTNLGKIKSALDYGRRSITGDLVEYIDHATEGFKPHPSAVGFELVYHKANFYRYEEEFRLSLSLKHSLREFEPSKSFLSTPPSAMKEAALERMRLARSEFLRAGPLVPVDLNALIQEVIISPGVGVWFADLVKNLIGKISTDIPIRASAVDTWPGKLA